MEIKSYNAMKANAQGIGIGLAGNLILLRSNPYIHTELRFSERFWNISVSATMQDKCKCVRFKDIKYTTPVWDTVKLDMTPSEETDIFEWCLTKAGLWKYDLVGLLSFTSKKEIIVPDKKKVWCDEFCGMAVGQKRELGVRPDSMNPTDFHYLMKKLMS